MSNLLKSKEKKKWSHLVCSTPETPSTYTQASPWARLPVGTPLWARPSWAHLPVGTLPRWAARAASSLVTAIPTLEIPSEVGEVRPQVVQSGNLSEVIKPELKCKTLACWPAPATTAQLLLEASGSTLMELPQLSSTEKL